MADFFEATKPEYQHEGPRPPVENALSMGYDAWFKLAEQLPAAPAAAGAAGKLVLVQRVYHHPQSVRILFVGHVMGAGSS